MRNRKRTPNVIGKRAKRSAGPLALFFDPKNPLRQKGFYSALALLIILACALFLRMIFATGINEPNDLASFDRVTRSVDYFTDGGMNLNSALQQARSDLGGIRNFIFYLPNMLIYLFFGVNQSSTLALPVILSLASIYVIYVICTLLTDNKVAGLLAAMFWAVFPLDIFYSTAAPRVSTLTFLFWLFILCLLLAFNKRSWLAIGFGSLILIGFFLWETQLLIIALMLALSMYFYETTQRRKPIFIFWAVIALILLFGGEKTGAAFLGFYSAILNLPEMAVFLPLFLVVITVLSLRGDKSAKKPLLASFIVLLGYIVIAVSLNPPEKPDLFSIGIFIQPLFGLLIISSGIYFSKDLTLQQSAPRVSMLSILVILGAWLAITGSRDFLPSFKGFDWIGLHSLFLIYSILGGIAFAGVMISPYLVTGTKADWKTKARFVLLAIILFATLSFSWNRRNEFHYLSTAPALALKYINENKVLEPIYSVNQATYQRIVFLSKMEDIFGDNRSPLSLTSMDQTDQFEEGLVLVFDEDLTITPPKNWWRVGAYGDLGMPRMIVYEVRSPQKAHDFLLSARDTDVKPIDIYGALINAGLSCEGYQVWKEYGQISLSNVRATPYPVQSDCLVRGENLVGMKDLTNKNNLEGYVYFPSSSDDPLDIAQVTLPIYDMRTTSVTVVLQPNTLYLYSIDIKTLSPTATLYWRVENNEDYLEMRRYPEWETVAMLILTPDWDTPKEAYFSPVLFDHLEVVSLRNFFIGPVELSLGRGD